MILGSGYVEKLPPDTGLIVVDHGSREEKANEMLLEVVELYATVSGTAIVELAHMEILEPTVAQAFARCIERGAGSVIVLPYFLSPGRHSTTDIPRLAEEAAARFPGVHIAVAQPLGVDERLTQVMQQRALEASVL